MPFGRVEGSRQALGCHPGISSNPLGGNSLVTSKGVGGEIGPPPEGPRGSPKGPRGSPEGSSEHPLGPILARKSTAAPQQQHHSSTTAAPPQHHNGTSAAAPQQHHSSGTTHGSSTTAAPQQHHGSSTKKAHLGAKKTPQEALGDNKVNNARC